MRKKIQDERLGLINSLTDQERRICEIKPTFYDVAVPYAKKRRVYSNVILNSIEEAGDTHALDY